MEIFLSPHQLSKLLPRILLHFRLLPHRINVNESNATKVEFVHPCSRVMSTIWKGREGCGRQPLRRFAASLFARPLVCPSSRQHFGPLRTVGADREREREREKGEQGGPGGDAMMRSRHMLRPLGDSAYTRLLINSQAFVLADNTGEITPGTLAFFRRQSTPPIVRHN